MLGVNVPNAILYLIILSGASIVGIILAVTIIAATGHPIPPEVTQMFSVIIAGTFTTVAAVSGHTLGFRNGTTNGEAQAQAQALRVTMGVDPKGTEHSE